MRSETNEFRAAAARPVEGLPELALALGVVLLLDRSLIDPWAI